ncbi:MAG: HAD family hydrolase [Phycisphaerales bacterium]|nr:MAG: HAD family hydrolase [Phycisphaerales bacterium]
MRLTDFDAMTFDCYGTIIDWERGILAILAPWAREQGLETTDDGLLEAFAALEGDIQRMNPTQPYPEVLRDVFMGLARRLGALADPEQARAFGESVGEWPPFADSAAALQSLKRTHQLAILSNVDNASIRRSVARLGVEFDLIVTAEDAGAYKPAHNHFENAFAWFERHGTPPERIVHVAQSLHHDHVPAKALGMRTIWVDRRRGKPGGATPTTSDTVTPDLVVASLEELAQMSVSG